MQQDFEKLGVFYLGRPYDLAVEPARRHDVAFNNLPADSGATQGDVALNDLPSDSFATRHDTAFQDPRRELHVRMHRHQSDRWTVT